MLQKKIEEIVSIINTFQKIKNANIFLILTQAFVYKLIYHHGLYRGVHEHTEI